MTDPAIEGAQAERFTGALRNVLNSRQDKYGSSDKCLELIADLWGNILRMPVTKKQVALCMIQLKVARLMGSHKVDYDSALDIAGYAALLARYSDVPD